MGSEVLATGADPEAGGGGRMHSIVVGVASFIARLVGWHSGPPDRAVGLAAEGEEVGGGAGGESYVEAEVGVVEGYTEAERSVVDLLLLSFSDFLIGNPAR